MPLTVKSVSDAEVVLELDGASVLKGCFSGFVTLHPGADGTWTGAFEDRPMMVWTRH
jgi:hypothetical protein